MDREEINKRIDFLKGVPAMLESYKAKGKTALTDLNRMSRWERNILHNRIVEQRLNEEEQDILEQAEKEGQYEAPDDYDLAQDSNFQRLEEKLAFHAFYMEISELNMTAVEEFWIHLRAHIITKRVFGRGGPIWEDWEAKPNEKNEDNDDDNGTKPPFDSSDLKSAYEGVKAVTIIVDDVCHNLMKVITNSEFSMDAMETGWDKQEINSGWKRLGEWIPLDDFETLVETRMKAMTSIVKLLPFTGEPQL